MTALVSSGSEIASRWLGSAAGITRDGARRDAARELSKSIYAGLRPSLLRRVLNAALQELTRVLAGAASATPGGWVGLLGLLTLAVAATVAVRMRVGPLARRHAVFDGADAGRALVAADHRARAEAFAAQGQWAEAVRERMRAIVRELEGRGVLDPRPGRTALEVAAEAGTALPAAASDLREAAIRFDEIWYGGRLATAAADAQLRATDARIQAARPVLPAAAR